MIMRYGWHFDKDYQKGDRQKDGEGRHFQGLDWLGPYCISGLLACAGCWGVGRQEGEEATYTTQVSGSEEKRELLIEQLKDVGFTTPTWELKFWKRGVRTDGSAINRTNQIPTGQGTGSGFGGTLRDAPYGDRKTVV